MPEDPSNWWAQYVRNNQQLILNIGYAVIESFCSYLKQLEKNQADSIKAGDVQVSRTELSVKEIILKGNEYSDGGEYSIALDYYDQAIKIDPNDDGAWYNKGNALYNLGKYNEAIESCDRAVKIDPNDDGAWYNKGNALYNLGKYDEAMQSCDRAIKIDPNDDGAWYNKGNALYNLGKYDEAMQSCDRAIKIDPNYAMKICQ